MSHLLAPQIVILKEGTDEAFGRGQIISNINSCAAVVDVVKTTLGKFITFLSTQNILLSENFPELSLINNALCNRTPWYGQTYPRWKRCYHFQ